MARTNESFSRTVSDGWGLSEWGGTWSVSHPSDFSVDGSAGRIVVGSSGTANTRRAHISQGFQFSLPIELLIDFKLQRLVSSTAQNVEFEIIDASLNRLWRAQVVVTTGGAMNVILWHSTGSGSTVAAFGSLSLWNNVLLRARFRIEQNQLSFRIWNKNNTEPGTWLTTLAHSVNATPAYFRINQYTSTGSNPSHDVWYDNIIQTEIADDSTHGDPFSLDALLKRTFILNVTANTPKLRAVIWDGAFFSQGPVIGEWRSTLSASLTSSISYSANEVKPQPGDLVIVSIATRPGTPADEVYTNPNPGSFIQNWQVVENKVANTGNLATFWKYWEDGDQSIAFMNFETRRVSDNVLVTARRVMWVARIDRGHAIQVIPVTDPALTQEPIIPAGSATLPSHPLLLGNFAAFNTGTSTTRWESQSEDLIEVFEGAVSNGSLVVYQKDFLSGGLSPAIQPVSQLDTATLAHLISVAPDISPLALDAHIYTGEFNFTYAYRVRGMWVEDFNAYSSLPPSWAVYDFWQTPATINNGNLYIPGPEYSTLEWREEQFFEPMYVEFDMFFNPGVDWTTEQYEFGLGTQYFVTEKYRGRISLWGQSGSSYSFTAPDGGWFHLKAEFSPFKERIELDEGGEQITVPLYTRIKLWNFSDLEPDEWTVVRQPTSGLSSPQYPTYNLWSSGNALPLRADNFVAGRLTDPLPLRFSLYAQIAAIPTFGISARIRGGIETALYVDDFNRDELNRNYVLTSGSAMPYIENGELRLPDWSADTGSSYGVIEGFPTIPADSAGTIEYDIFIPKWASDWDLYWEVGAGSFLDTAANRYRRTYVYAYYYDYVIEHVQVSYLFGVGNACYAIVSVTPNTWYSIKASIPKTLAEPYRIKVWPRHESEPTTWNTEVLDAGGTSPGWTSSYIELDHPDYNIIRMDNLVITSDVRSFTMQAVIVVPSDFRIQAVIQGATPAPSLNTNAIVKKTWAPPKPLAHRLPYVASHSTWHTYTYYQNIPVPSVQAGDLVILTVAAGALSNGNASNNSFLAQPSTPAAPWIYHVITVSNQRLYVLYYWVAATDPWTAYTISGSAVPRAISLMVVRDASSFAINPTNLSIGLATLSNTTINTNPKTLSVTSLTNNPLRGENLLMLSVFTGKGITYWRVATPEDEELPNTTVVWNPERAVNMAISHWMETFTSVSVTGTPNAAEFSQGMLMGIVGSSTQFKLLAWIGTGGKFGINSYIQPDAQTTTHPRTGPHYDQTPADYLHTLTAFGTLPPGTSLHDVLVDIDHRITDLEEQR
jgi:hypothetical protein